eukprot:3956442-Prymnesium_polylepis.1
MAAKIVEASSGAGSTSGDCARVHVRPGAVCRDGRIYRQARCARCDCTDRVVPLAADSHVQLHAANPGGH